MWVRILTAALGAVLALFSLRSAHAGEAKAGREAPQLYAQFCAACHGDKLQGGKARTLLDDQWRHGGDDRSLERSIRDGMPAAGMPAFGGSFNDAELRALVVLIRETVERTRSPEAKTSSAPPAGVQCSEVQSYRVETVAEGLEVPWSIAFLPEERMLVTERVGRLRMIERGRLSPAPVEGIPQAWVRDEGGLLSVTPHPDFARNGWVYLSFSDRGGDDEHAMTKLVRGRIRDGRWADEETIFSVPREMYQKGGINFGSRLAFAGEHLFFTVGERGQIGEAQDLAKPNGKVHRTFHDGRVPSDNPFVDTPGGIASIWSYGHRNPQGLARNPVDGALWSTEHGPRGGDELNRIERGKNYGWPKITYGTNYDGSPITNATAADGMEQPAAHWTPSIAVCPILFYDGDKLPGWKNALFLGSLGQQEFRRIVVVDGAVKHQELIFKNHGRVRDIQTGPDGFIYLALELPGEPGRIVRLVPAG